MGGPGHEGHPGEAVTSLPELPFRTHPVPQGLPEAEDEDEQSPRPWWRPQVGFVSALGFCCAGFALLFASMVSLSILTFPLSCAGLLLGIVGLMIFVVTEKGSPFWPALAAGLNLCVLLLALLWPRLFAGQIHDPWQGRPDGATTFRVPLAQDIHATPVAVEEGEWVDASQFALQQRGMHVSIPSISKGLPGVKKVRPDTKEDDPRLAIKVRLQNVGMVETLEGPLWTRSPEGEGEESPRLQDEQGQPYLLTGPVLLGDGIPAAPRLRLQPHDEAELTLLFARPPAEWDSLRLELPGSAFGGEGLLRFRLPRSLLSSR